MSIEFSIRVKSFEDRIYRNIIISDEELNWYREVHDKKTYDINDFNIAMINEFLKCFLRKNN